MPNKLKYRCDLSLVREPQNPWEVVDASDFWMEITLPAVPRKGDFIKVYTDVYRLVEVVAVVFETDDPVIDVRVKESK